MRRPPRRNDVHRESGKRFIGRVLVTVNGVDVTNDCYRYDMRGRKAWIFDRPLKLIRDEIARRVLRGKVCVSWSRNKARAYRGRRSAS